MDIAGKVFIVTGAASGLGEGTARALAARGGKVVIADMQADKGAAIAQDIGGAFVRCDVSNEDDGQMVVAKAVSMGKLMGLVNCAGIAPAEKTVGKHGAHNLGVFTKCITVNLVAPLDATPDDIRRIPEAAFNVILYPEVARAMAFRGAEVFVHSSSEIGSPLATAKAWAKAPLWARIWTASSASAASAGKAAAGPPLAKALSRPPCQSLPCKGQFSITSPPGRRP
jgi:NAD(P)-dependent dehydrogenase (short-subunit alcohol dehydrogenase family)